MSKIVIGVSKGMLSVKYFCSSKASLCQLNFMKIIRLLQSLAESGHLHFWGHCRIYGSGFCLGHYVNTWGGRCEIICEVSYYNHEYIRVHVLFYLDVYVYTSSETTLRITFWSCLYFVKLTCFRLPDGLWQLKNLTHLGLNDVSLTKLPPEISR